jgi:hypothetical protein
MSFITDSKYALLASPRLLRFKQGKDYRYYFNCPFCGDDPKKGGRGSNIYPGERGDNLMFHCYRCNESLSLRDFLQRIDPYLAEEYKKESRTDWFYRYTQPIKLEKPQPPVYQPGSTTIFDGLA